MTVDAAGPRIRAAAVINRGAELLLVKHVKNGKEYFLLPGGGVERGESLSMALGREVEEETGLKIQAGKLLCVSETIFPDLSRHIVHVVFHAEEKGGDIAAPGDKRVRGVDFVGFKDLESIVLLPPIAGFLKQSYDKGFAGGASYLGSLWKDLES